MCAHQFFGLVHNPVVAAAIGKPEPPPVDSDIGLPTTVPFEPWSVADFSRYLSTLGLPAAGDAVTLHRILSSMERAGLLLPLGWDPRLPVMGQKYISQGAISKGQRGGNLWLSEVFGAELIIPSYNAVTVQLAGHDDAGNPVDSWGTGLVVDHNHVITNKHVVTGLAGTSAGLSVYPSSNHAEAELVNFSGTAHPHPTLDVAVIKFEMPEGKYIPRLGGMAFRDPDWADEVYVFGYPRVPMTAEMAITVAELHKHQLQIDLHRRRRPAPARVEERHERGEERRIVQQCVHPGQFLGQSAHLVGQQRLPQPALIA